MLLSQINSENLTDEQVEEILFSIPEDDKKTGDCIFVFGSKIYLEERTNLAVKLYKEKRTPKILFSGGLGKKRNGSRSISYEGISNETRRSRRRYFN